MTVYWSFAQSNTNDKIERRMSEIAYVQPLVRGNPDVC